jgi:cysteine desulfuration protein SufE
MIKMRTFSEIKTRFAECKTPEEKYLKIIELGKLLPPLNPQFKTSELIVPGCQSIVYLHSYLNDGLVYFEAESEALISAGLAYLLITAYNGEKPETILKCPPTFINELGISATLTPGRANGLASIYLRMKQDALKFLMIQTADKS